MREQSGGESGKASVRIVEASEADPKRLAAFFDEAFGPTKRRFLIEHGDWWHRGSPSRFVALLGDEVAGYRAMIPTVCLHQGTDLPAVWGIDLFVAPRFRGQGLQRLLDQRLLDASDLKMSFPGELGAKIYLKQGYGLREDLRMLRAPLGLLDIPTVEEAQGARRLALHTAVRAALPIAAVLRARALRYRPKRTEAWSDPDTGTMEDIFRKYVRDQTMTTLRSADFLQWRYLDAPYRPELIFYLTSRRDRWTHYAITRYLSSERGVKGRVLDVFGDFQDEEGLTDLLRTVVRDAATRESRFVELLSSSPGFARVARSAGFLVSTPRRFRWLSDVPSVQETLSIADLAWTLGDSDNDPPG